MKMVLIAYSEAADYDLIGAIKAAGVTGYTKFTEVLGEGTETEHGLQVQVDEEEHRDPGGAEQQLGDVRRGEVRRAEDAEAHERLALLRLQAEEGDEQRQSGAADGHRRA